MELFILLLRFYVLSRRGDDDNDARKKAADSYQPEHVVSSPALQLLHQR